MEQDFKFEVGATYQNMKGDYEVLSIKGENMTIRWTDGSEITTTVDQQLRILERLDHEKRMAEIAAEKSKKKK